MTLNGKRIAIGGAGDGRCDLGANGIEAGRGSRGGGDPGDRLRGALAGAENTVELRFEATGFRGKRHGGADHQRGGGHQAAKIKPHSSDHERDPNPNVLAFL